QARNSTPEDTKTLSAFPQTIASDSGKSSMTRPRILKSAASKPTPVRRRRRRVRSREQNPTLSPISKNTPQNIPSPKQSHSVTEPLASAPRVDVVSSQRLRRILRFPITTPLRRAFLIFCALTTLVIAYAINSEITTSNLQSHYLAEFGKKL